MQARTVTWKHAVRAWWSFSWRWPLYMIPPVLLVGGVIALVKPGYDFMLYFQPIFAWTTAFACQILAMKKVLNILRDASHER